MKKLGISYAITWLLLVAAGTAFEALQIASQDTPIEPETEITNRRRKRGQTAVKKIQVQVLK